MSSFCGVSSLSTSSGLESMWVWDVLNCISLFMVIYKSASSCFRQYRNQGNIQLWWPKHHPNLNELRSWTKCKVLILKSTSSCGKQLYGSSLEFRFILTVNFNLYSSIHNQIPHKCCTKVQHPLMDVFHFMME